jgi:hypothetical protein
VSTPTTLHSIRRVAVWQIRPAATAKGTALAWITHQPFSDKSGGRSVRIAATNGLDSPYVCNPWRI